MQALACTDSAFQEKIKLSEESYNGQGGFRTLDDYRFAAHFAKTLIQKDSDANQLECYMCFYGASDFGDLAQHVQSCHVPRLERKESEETMALKVPTGKNTATSPAGGTKSPIPYVKVEDIPGKDRWRCKITAVDPNGSGYNDVVVKIAANGRKFFYGLKINNPSYATLVDALGSDETQWIGREFSLGLQYNETYEKNYLHVYEVYSKSAAK